MNSPAFSYVLLETWSNISNILTIVVSFCHLLHNTIIGESEWLFRGFWDFQTDKFIEWIVSFLSDKISFLLSMSICYYTKYLNACIPIPSLTKNALLNLTVCMRSKVFNNIISCPLLCFVLVHHVVMYKYTHIVISKNIYWKRDW